MKNILLTVSALTLLGATAQAQMVFDGGEISASAMFPTGSGLSGATNYGIAGNAAVSFGSIGLQADFGYNTAQGGVISSPFFGWNAGLHAYYKVSDTFKAGAFYARETIGDNSDPTGLVISTFGAEALFELGNVDVEVSIGGFSTNSDNGLIVTADGYYQISDALELNGGVWILNDINGSANQLTVATIGAKYSLTNIPVSLGVSYSAGFEAGVGAPGGSISANVSYDFGAGNGSRRFSNRNFDYMGLIFSYYAP